MLDEKKLDHSTNPTEARVSSIAPPRPTTEALNATSFLARRSTKPSRMTAPMTAVRMAPTAAGNWNSIEPTP